MRSPVWPVKRPSARNKQGFRPVIIGVNAAKDVIRGRLHLDRPAPDEPCPGYMHYPADRDINYFAQLISERLTTKTVNGQRFRVWELPPGRANEALDLAVYSYAALCGLLHFGLRLNQRAEAVAAPYSPKPRLPDPPPSETLIVQGPIYETPVPTVSVVRSAERPLRRGLAGRLAGG